MWNRPPSQAWEPVAIEPTGRCFIWCWFAPDVAPAGVMLQLPAELFWDPVAAPLLTVRYLAAVLGINGELLGGWSVHGGNYDAEGGQSAWLDQVIPGSGAEVMLLVWLAAPQATAAVPLVAAGATPDVAAAGPTLASSPRPTGDGDAMADILAQAGEANPTFEMADILAMAESATRPEAPGLPASVPPAAYPPQAFYSPMPQAYQPYSVQYAAPAAVPAAAAWNGQDVNTAFNAIETAWLSIRSLETQIVAARNQLEQALGKLNGMNRELSADEGRFADNQDKMDWRDARRWLREAAAYLQRSVKEIDMGTTSAAGQRNWFEDTYKRYVTSRTPFEGLTEAVSRFEAHRKLVQNVVSSAQAGLSKSGREAEQRAQQVLRRIGEKVRKGRR